MRFAAIQFAAVGIAALCLINSGAQAQEPPHAPGRKIREVRVDLSGDDDSAGQYCSLAGGKCALLLRPGAGQSLTLHAKDGAELAEGETIAKAVIELEATGSDNNPNCPAFVGSDNSVVVTLDSKSVGSTSLNGVPCWSKDFVQYKDRKWPLWVVEFPKAIRSAALGPLPHYHIQLGGTDKLVSFVPIRAATLVLAIETRR